MGDNLTSMIFFTTVLFETSFNVYFRKISMEAEVLHTFFFLFTQRSPYTVQHLMAKL